MNIEEGRDQVIIENILLMDFLVKEPTTRMREDHSRSLINLSNLTTSSQNMVSEFDDLNSSLKKDMVQGEVTVIPPVYDDMMTKIFGTFDRTYHTMINLLAAKDEEVKKVMAQRDAAEKEAQNLKLRI